jgi:dolichol-phosphate mannosyltransferase
MTSRADGGAELSVVVPTFNERDNVCELVARLKGCLLNVNWEVIFVDDDSSDKTAELVRELGQQDGRVRCIQRIGRRGLSSACVEGILASSAPYIAVIDGDLQHDERLLPAMLRALHHEDLDIVIGSRYVEGGDTGDWNRSRVTMSTIAVWLSRLVVRADLKDPMSGFFMLRRTTFMRCVRRLSAIGFKILVDLFASSPDPLRFKELPYTFRTRHAGESKLDNQVIWDYTLLLIDKLIGHLVPVRFVSFGIVGALGIAIHFIILIISLKYFGAPFVDSQAFATAAAVTFNFLLNNALTYRDVRLRGWRLLRGWISFTLTCSVGALANVGIAAYLFHKFEAQWPLAALGGILIGAVWNYAVTNVYTWSTPKRV